MSVADFPQEITSHLFDNISCCDSLGKLTLDSCDITVSTTVSLAYVVSPWYLSTWQTKDLRRRMASGNVLRDETSRRY